MRIAILLLLVLASSSTAAAAPAGAVLPGAYLRQKGSTRCGFVGSKWEPGEVKSGKFYSYKSKISDGSKRLKRTSGATRARLDKQIKSWQSKRSKQQGFCRTVLDPRKVSNISRLPSNSKFVAGSVAAAGVQSVSGTAPLLKSLPNSDIKSLFWPSGVVEAMTSGSPSQAQCQQYGSGAADGDHGGIAACNMVSNLGYSLSPILRAGINLCYLQNGPSAENLSSGGVTLQKGAFPNSDPAQLFDPPKGSTARLVKVSVTSPNLPPLYVRIHPVSGNQQQGNEYRAEFWSCWSGRTWADSYQSVTISSAKQYTYTYADNEGSTDRGYQFTVTAGLKIGSDGVVTFDDAVERRAVTAFLDPENVNFGFKSDITVTGGTTLRNKNRWLFSYGWRSDVLLMEFSGTDLSDLRYLHGALKSEDHNNGQPVTNSQVGLEFRDSRYAFAPQAALLTAAGEVDLAQDSFYAEAPAVNIDLSAYSCAPDTDIELSLDGANTAVAAVLLQCQANTLWDSDFCRGTAELSQAYNGWQANCS